MEEKKGFVFNIGTPSILVILLTFVLCTFALFSIRASSSERKLSEKTGRSVQEYYLADKKAVHALAYIEAVLETSEVQYLEETLVGAEAGKEESIAGISDVKVNLEEHASFVMGTEGSRRRIGQVSYSYPVREGVDLQVALEIYNDRSYVITQWSTTQAASDILDLEDGGFELWDGNVTAE